MERRKDGSIKVWQEDWRLPLITVTPQPQPGRYPWGHHVIGFLYPPPPYPCTPSQCHLSCDSPLYHSLRPSYSLPVFTIFLFSFPSYSFPPRPPILSTYHLLRLLIALLLVFLPFCSSSSSKLYYSTSCYLPLLHLLYSHPTCYLKQNLLLLVFFSSFLATCSPSS